MKKLISFILVACIFMTMVQISFAEDTASLENDEIAVSDILVNMEFEYNESDSGKQIVSGEDFSVNAVISNCTTTQADCLMVIALYKGAEMKIKKTRQTIVAGGGTVLLSDSITMPEEDLAEYSVKIMFWDNLSRIMPYTCAVSVSNEILAKDEKIDEFGDLWSILPLEPYNVAMVDTDEGVNVFWEGQGDIGTTKYAVIAKNSDGNITYRSEWKSEKSRIIPYDKALGNTLYVVSQNQYGIISDFKECSQGSDDASNSISGALKITLDNAVEKQINYLGDKDYFEYTAEQDGEYIIEYLSQSSSSSVMIKDDCGNTLIQSNDFEHRNNYKIGYKFKENEKFYVCVKADEETEYKFTVKCVPLFEMDAPSVNTDTNVVTISGTSSVSEFYAYTLEVYNPDNTLIHISRENTSNLGEIENVLELENPKNGTYQVIVSPVNGFLPYYLTFNYNTSSDINKVSKSYIQSSDYYFNTNYVEFGVLNDDDGNPVAVNAKMSATYAANEGSYQNYIKKDVQMLATFIDNNNVNRSFFVVPRNDVLPGETVVFDTTLYLPEDYENCGLMICLLDGDDVYTQNIHPVADGGVIYFNDVVSLEEVNKWEMNAAEYPYGIAQGENPLCSDENAEAGEAFRLNRNIALGNVIIDGIEDGGELMEINNGLFGTASGLVYYDTIITSNNRQVESLVNQGEVVSINMELENISDTVIENININFIYNDVLSNPINLPVKNLGAGESLNAKATFNLGRAEENSLENIKIVISGNNTKIADILIDTSDNNVLGTSEDNAYNLKEKTNFTGNIKYNPETPDASVTKYFKFVPKTDGYYVVRIKSSTAIEGNLYSKSRTSNSDFSDLDDTENSFEAIAFFESGLAYNLEVSYVQNKNAEFNIQANRTYGTGNDVIMRKSIDQKVYYDDLLNSTVNADGTTTVKRRKIGEMNAGNACGTVSTDDRDEKDGTNIGTGKKYYTKYHYVDAENLAEKIIAIALIEHNFENKNEHDYTFSPPGIYIAGANGDFLEISGSGYAGGTSEVSGLQYVRIPDGFEGSVYASAGLALKSKPDGTLPESTQYHSMDYNLSVKILDTVKFGVFDSIGEKSTTGRNYFVSAGPERITDGAICTEDKKVFLTCAPVNGNARLYWHHLNEANKDVIFGVMLYNKENTPIEITINSRNFTRPNIAEEKGALYTSVWNNTDLIKNDATYTGKTFTIEPNQKIWVCAYDLASVREGSYYLGTNGVMNLTIEQNDNLYSGEKLLCMTYAIDPVLEDYALQETEDWSKKDIDLYKVANQLVNTSSYMSEAESDGTALRGSGEGPVISANIENFNITSKSIKNIAFAGADLPSLMGDYIKLTRYINSDCARYYIGEGDNIYSGISARVKIIDKNGEDVTKEKDNDMWNILEKQIKSRYTNYGVVYQIKFNNVSENAVKGKIKLTPRVNSGVSNDIYAGLHINIWKYEDNTQKTIYEGILKNGSHMYIVDEDESETGAQKFQRDGVLCVFENDIPKGENIYYIAVTGMSTLPFEISFENL